jgi:hypothetical protein
MGEGRFEIGVLDSQEEALQISEAAGLSFSTVEGLGNDETQIYLEDPRVEPLDRNFAQIPKNRFIISPMGITVFDCSNKPSRAWLFNQTIPETVLAEMLQHPDHKISHQGYMYECEFLPFDDLEAARTFVNLLKEHTETLA